MRVNFASGEHPFPAPWWNVDLNDHIGVSEHVDLLDEFPPSITDVERAYVGHWLEHLTVSEAVEFLTRVRAAMRPGGQIVVVGPDVERAEAMNQAGQLPDGLLAAIRPHGERYGNDVSHIHAWPCTAEQVRRMMSVAGLTGVDDLDWSSLAALDIPVISDAPWQFVLTATVPA